MQFQRTVFDNGLRVITAPMPSLESATVLVVVGAGSRYENKENNGISHFLEHMAFKGTKKRPTSREIAMVIDEVGGEFNAFTSKEVTGFYIKSAATHIDLSLDVISDLLQNSIFDSQETEKEKGVIIQEINMFEDMPMRQIPDVYTKLLYGDTPLGWDTAGEKSVIRKATRQDFLDYMGKLYSPSNMSVIVAGGINHKESLDLVRKYFGQMKAFDTISYKKVVVDQAEPRFLLKRKKTEQIHIGLGFETAPLCSPDRYPLAILSTVLGGGMSSRLFEEVREKRGLAYFVRTSSQHFQDHGTLATFAGLDSEKIHDAIKVILEEYEKIKTKDQVGKKELAKAKEMLKGNLIREMEDSLSVAEFYGQQEILETEIETLKAVVDKVDAVTIDQINEAVSRYFVDKKLNLAVIGDIEDGETLHKELSL